MQRTVPRNVVTLSDVPPDLHQWFREEAHRRSDKAGKRVGICSIVVEAMMEHKARLEKDGGQDERTPVEELAGSAKIAGVEHG